MSPKLLLCLALLLSWATMGSAQALSPLAPKPNWAELEPFQQTITRDEFTRLLVDVYAPNDAAKDFIEIGPDAAVIRTSLNPPASWTLRFAVAGEAKPVPRFWKAPAELGPAPEGKPLAGVRIAIDPGHLGGAWAKMEQRFFQIGESRPVVEGEMTLRVAKMLVPRLQALGAEVHLVRAAEEPVTKQRPATLRPVARQEIATRAAELPPVEAPPEPVRERAEKDGAELLFYRVSEIRERAKLVNEKIRPDVTLCLHFNAEAWGDAAHPEFVPRNHLHILLNGCYSAGELRHDDVRFDMLMKLLGRCFPPERAAGAAAASALAKATGLPAYSYTTNNALMVADNNYLWARNLLANRLYRTPVVYYEPYVMNNEVTWARVQAGDYEGEYLIGGALRKSIYREYADGVVEGLKEYYKTRAEAVPAPPR